MKKRISTFMSLFGHKISFDFQVEPEKGSFKEERDKKIVNGYERNHHIRFLAKKYNLSESRIVQILAAHGARKSKWHKMSPTTRREIFRLWDKGFNKSEIGRKVGVTRERIRQILNEIHRSKKE